MHTVRRARCDDHPTIWALADLPNIGHTADAAVPLPLQPAVAPPAAFPDLADVHASFVDRGGDFVVAEERRHLVGTGGFRPTGGERVEILRVRVHPARRRLGIGRTLMHELERRAFSAGYALAHLDTATNQPEAVAFYRALGYEEVGTETRPEWTWTLVYFAKRLGS